MTPMPPGTQETDLATVLGSLHKWEAQIDLDPASRLDPAFQLRARAQLLQSIATTPRMLPASPLNPVIAWWDGLGGRHRLLGAATAVAFGGLLVVPAFAAPHAMSNVVNTAISVMNQAPDFVPGMPVPLFYQSNAPGGTVVTVETDSDTTSATSSTASSTTASTASTQSSTSTTSTSTSTTEAASDNDSHGDDVSAVALDKSLTGREHGEAVSSVARGDSTVSTTSTTGTTAQTSVSTSTSTATATGDGNNDEHGDAVSAAAHTSTPSGENHGQEVRSVAYGESSAVTITTTTSHHQGKGNGNSQGNNDNGQGNGGKK